MRRPPVQAEQGDKGTAAFAMEVDMGRGHLTLTLQTGTSSLAGRDPRLT
jgi:hypothetical protein